MDNRQTHPETRTDEKIQRKHHRPWAMVYRFHPMKERIEKAVLVALMIGAIIALITK